MSTTIPQTFRAAFIDEAQAVVRVGSTSFSSPALSPDEVSIRVTATAINPVDWKVRDTGMLIQSWPAILGFDGAGVVVEVGSNFASKFQPGDRVFFQGVLGKNDSSTFQEYTRIPAHAVGKTPDAISDEAAASLSMAGVTAAVGLYHKTGRALSPAPWDAGGSKAGEGKAIVVLGGSTSVGQFVIQLARLSGYTRIVAGAGAAHTELLKGLGAHVVLDRATKGGWRDYVDAVGPSVQLDFVYDAIALDHAQLKGVQIIQALGDQAASEALVVTVGLVDDEAIAAGQGGGEGGGLRTVNVRSIVATGHHPDYRYVGEPLYESFSKWLASGELLPNHVRVVPGGLEGIEEAMQLNKAGVSGVKLIVKL
ncbi:chaperonin 10-like protein [Microdochium bolleyi]|uniref:Chaperonin 10-like protein n=1 Tax=Microdochium bolleyi TaxID=196109 RepID=A0A136IMH7_9PEZI|nr:chaperonin 10-like protein [Microdochium bolleyi]